MASKLGDQGSALSEKVTLHALIRAHYAAMPPVERILADTLLNFPGQLASYSATELAKISISRTRRSPASSAGWASPATT